VSLTGLEDGLTAYLFQRARGTGRDLDCGLAGLSPEHRANSHQGRAIFDPDL